MKAIQLARFPKIKHTHANWCIPAAVENMVRYHGGDIAQVDIAKWVNEIPGGMHTIKGGTGG